MELLHAEGLATELMAQVLSAEGKAFTLTKSLGVCRIRLDGEQQTPESDPDLIRQNAAAVRLLHERYPSLTITYPQSSVMEFQSMEQPDTQVSVRQTEAVIQVPEDFVAIHSGIAFQALLQDRWAEQLKGLVSEITRLLQKYEIKTQRLFGADPHRPVILRLSDDAIETDIWTLPLRKCGLFPLQWDGEVCGMAILLSKQLETAMADITGKDTQFTLQRMEKIKQCHLTLRCKEEDIPS